MNTILGLDLGTNSVGWALIEVDGNNKPTKIIALGSRIIPLSSDDRDEFQKGQAISKNQKRTIARTQRKGYNRYQLRKDALKTILKELNIFPSEDSFKLPVLDLWKLRSDAATKNSEISAEQLGRILYMLNQKRGYKSVRTEANQDKKDSDYVEKVKGRFKQLKEKQQTIGNYFYDELLTANRENKYYRTKERVYPREAYIEEFDRIINAQKSKHTFLTDCIIEKLRNEIIFYQRSLKSQKSLVNICEFEGFEVNYFDKETKREKIIFAGPKVAPKTSPLYQLCKIWETVNNISLKIKNQEGSKYKWNDRIPTLVEKEKIIEHLNKNSNLSYIDLLDILELKKENVYANKQILKGIQGNITYTEIQRILGENKCLQFNLNLLSSKNGAILADKKTGEILEEKDRLWVDAKVEQEPLYQLWHTIYSLKDIHECERALIKRFGFNPEIAEKLSKLDFNKQSFGNKSNKAIRKILPYLMQGYNYSQACSFAGYNHSHSLTQNEQIAKITIDKLALLPKNALRQPIVEKIINQMINVVNEILKIYGKPNEIRVELARELKQSKEERNDTDIQNSNNKKLNDEVAKRLASLELPATKQYIQKYKFIFPVKDKKIKDAQVINQCIYCGNSFNLTEALSGDDFDVDHIVPQALLFDDSQTNKVLVHRSCNADKSNKTAYDYIAAKGEKTLQQYLDRVDCWFKRGILSYNKMQRLKVSYEEYTDRKKRKKETDADKKIWESFINRQLRETQYIARKSKEILQQICNNVTATEGTVTSKLRELWGWDDVLMNLQMPKYKAFDQTIVKEWTSNHGKRKHQKEEIKNWSKRDDHRHHAIDALVIACTQQGFIQRINTLSSSDVKDEMKKEVEAELNYNNRLTLLDNYLVSKRPFMTSEVGKHVENILVSFKAGKKAATQGVRKEKRNGKKEIVQSNIIVPRGALHEQFIYGKIKIKAKDFKTDQTIQYPVKFLFENSELIVEQPIREKVKKRLAQFGSDAKKAIDSLKKEPIYLDAENTRILTSAHCYKDEYVIKYKISDLKKEDVKYIVDEKVKTLVKNRLEQFNDKEKEAFKDTLWFNEEKQIPILSVRCFTGLAIVEAIKKDENGNDIGFSIPGNNHHVAIYKDNAGKQIQHLCTFWHAVERKKYKIPYVIRDTKKLWNSILDRELPERFLQKLPDDNLELQFSLQQNEMFVLGLSREQFEEAISQNRKALLSMHLYLVWSISDNDYWFRHHLETKNSELKNIAGAKESRRYFRFKSISAFSIQNPIKVRLNHLGEITKIGE
ncbi:type II CRISPR RNA-guided endonuclease Cas9 [Chitinophagaceae bacterium LWZ2-11]